MLYYFASNINHNFIAEAIKKTDQVVVGSECNQELQLLPYVKDHYADFSSVDTVIVDIAGIKDTDEAILEALNMLRICNDQMQIIVIATQRLPGDSFLAQCFSMSIYDLITTDDFNDLEDEIVSSLQNPRQYKESVRYKDIIDHSVKDEEKKEVTRITVGFAGTQGHIGVTHHAIILSNCLRRKGFKVALVELNESGDFAKIAESYDLGKSADHFVKDGIDYYPAANTDTMLSLGTRAYNFIVVDYGTYNRCDLDSYQHCSYKFIFSGIKPWEELNIQSVFEMGQAAGADLAEYHYFFNFCPDDVKADVRAGMAELDKVYFCEMHPDPFSCYTFPSADEIFADLLPVKKETDKQRRGGRK